MKDAGVVLLWTYWIIVYLLTWGIYIEFDQVGLPRGECYNDRE